MNNNLSYLKEQEKFLCKMQGMNINCLSVHISKTLSQCSFNGKVRKIKYHIIVQISIDVRN